MRSPRRRRLTIVLVTTLSLGLTSLVRAQDADLVLLDGRILTVDAEFAIAEALAVKEGRILAVGQSDAIKKHVGPETQVRNLNGKTVVPGFIETHCHAIGVARGALRERWAELSSIGEIQEWIRRRTRDLPAGRWIRVPRTDITRIKERRFPTVAELDAAAPEHPVVFNAARKNVLNTLGFKRLGVTADVETIGGGKVIRDGKGNPQLIAGGDAAIRQFFPRPEFSDEETIEALRSLHRVYNSCGITSIFERAMNRQGYDLYRRLGESGPPTVRATLTIREQFRSGDEVEPFTEKLGLKTGDGDDWVRVGPLKITVDGGIHWGTTYLSEPYGKRRIAFYRLEGIQTPEWRGSLRYNVDRMQEIFEAGHRLGWQMCVHVTGDGGVDAVLEALRRANNVVPLTQRRFTLTHAYFPSAEAARRAAGLGVCVDTQTYLYYKDSDAMAQVYGKGWAARFIGLKHWLEAGVPTAVNSDHMIGTDPDHALQSFNPFLHLWIAVKRENEQGDVHGPEQRLGRREALRCVTSHAAFLGFDETRKGSLEKGKLADFVILDRDYLTCPVEEIRKIKPLATYVGGRLVFGTED